MKTYTDARTLREDLKKDEVPPKVVVEFSTEILAAMLGQRFTDQNGNVLSMEQVRIGYDAFFERAIADPVVMRVVPSGEGE